ncbi:MAG: hypothetical protein U1B30_08840 [Pseudomonadota bacterium]|nr:hypothetical protein [Pseudomonadota bacterium]
MKIFELHDRTEFFLMNRFSFSCKEVADIALDSVFWGEPNTKENHIDLSIVLDSNLFNYIRQDPRGVEATKIVNISRDLGLKLDPSFALIEQRIRHGNPKRAIEEYAAALKSNFGINIGCANVDAFDAHLDIYSDNLRYNISLLRDYLPAIKRLWNQDGSPIDKMSSLVDTAISKNLPIFTVAFLFAAVAFLAKEKTFEISEAQRSKIQSDMSISSKNENENMKLWNVAFDIGIFVYCVDSAIRPNLSQLFLTKIASADKTFPVFSENIKCTKLTIDYSLPKPIVIGGYGLASGPNISKKMSEEMTALIPQRMGRPTPDEVIIRRCNLAKFANETAGFNLTSTSNQKKRVRSD